MQRKTVLNSAGNVDPLDGHHQLLRTGLSPCFLRFPNRALSSQRDYVARRRGVQSFSYDELFTCRPRRRR